MQLLASFITLLDEAAHVEVVSHIVPHVTPSADLRCCVNVLADSLLLWAPGQPPTSWSNTAGKPSTFTPVLS